MKNFNILCTICARGGSKGVKNKNIKKLNGIPLIAHSINHAKESKLFSHIVVSSDSDEILQVAKDYGAEVFFKREPQLSNDTAGKVKAIQDAFIRSEEHFKTKFDFLFDLDATSPLRYVSDLHNAFKQFLENDNNLLQTGMIARKNPYFNIVEMDENSHIHLSKKPKQPVLSRQNAPKCYDLNASIYIWKRQTILKYDSVFVENCGLYIMPENRSIDIDNETDFKFVEFLLKQRSENEM